MTVRRYILLTRSDSTLLQKRIAATFARWQRDWCAGGNAAEIELWKKSDPKISADIEWQVVTADADLAVGVAVADPDALVTVLVGNTVTNESGDKQTNGIAEDLRRKSLHALAAMLINESNLVAPDRSLERTSTLPREEMWKDNHGFLVARCRIGQTEIFILLYPRVTTAYLHADIPGTKRRGQGLVHRQSVLGSQATTLQISAGDAQLTLSELTTLTVGDVVTLDRRLRQPLLVKLSHDAVICKGYLGTQGEQKAVQLTSLSESNEA